MSNNEFCVNRVRSKVVADVAVTPVLGKSGVPPKSPPPLLKGGPRLPPFEGGPRLPPFEGGPRLPPFEGGLGGILFHQRVLTTPV